MKKIGMWSLAIASLLSGCAATVPLQRDQVDRLTAEASMNDVQTLLGKASAVRSFEFNAQGKAYAVREYRLQTGTQQEMSVVCTPLCVPVSYPVAVTTDYVLVREAGAERLLAWGSLEELSKSSNERISALMPALKEARNQLLASEKK